MATSIFPTGLRSWVRGYILVLFVALAALGVHLAKVGRDWPLGDWQINYHGGFVRRGLAGEILLRAGHILHIDPIYLAVVLAIACYGTLFLTVWKLLDRSSWDTWVVLLLVSPATFLFPLLSSRGSYHKEVLYFAALSILILMLARTAKIPGDAVIASYLTFASIVLVLSHEPLAIFLPYLAAVLYLFIPDFARLLKIAILPAIGAAVALAFSVTHLGSSSTVEAICSSVGADPQHPCSQLILFLSSTKEGQLALVADNVVRFHYLRNYSILLLVILIPIIMGLRSLYLRADSRQAVNALGLAILISSIGSVQLFRYGQDWGRWINMHVISIMLVMLVIDAVSSKSSAPRVQATFVQRFAIVALVVIYATSWSLPHYGDAPLFGLDGKLVGALAHHRRSAS